MAHATLGLTKWLKFEAMFYFHQVSALSFSESGSHFVTVGVRHVKFWYFDTESNKSKVREDYCEVKP